MKKYKYLLFDLDNTLLDFTKSSEVSFKKMIGQYSNEDVNYLFSEYYKINKACWEAVERNEIPLSKVKIVRFERFNSRFDIAVSPEEINAHYFSLLRETVFFVEHAKEVLNDLKSRGVGMSIVTNGLKEVQERRLELSGILPFFDAVIISDAIGVKKPEEAFFTYTLKQIPKFEKDKYLVIGDTPGSDILGAYHSNLPSCWFNPKNKSWVASDYKPDHTISSLFDLLDLI